MVGAPVRTPCHTVTVDSHLVNLRCTLACHSPQNCVVSWRICNGDSQRFSCWGCFCCQSAKLQGRETSAAAQQSLARWVSWAERWPSQMFRNKRRPKKAVGFPQALPCACLRPSSSWTWPGAEVLQLVPESSAVWISQSQVGCTCYLVKSWTWCRPAQHQLFKPKEWLQLGISQVLPTNPAGLGSFCEIRIILLLLVSHRNPNGIGPAELAGHFVGVSHLERKVLSLLETSNSLPQRYTQKLTSFLVNGNIFGICLYVYIYIHSKKKKKKTRAATWWEVVPKSKLMIRSRLRNLGGNWCSNFWAWASSGDESSGTEKIWKVRGS